MIRSLLLLSAVAFSSLFGLDVGNGKSLVLSLDAPEGKIVFEDRNISVLAHPADPRRGIAIVPIDYHTPPKTLRGSWVTSSDSVELDLNITAAVYPIETLTVESAKVSPPPEVLERIASEKAEAEAIYNHFTPQRYWNRPFIRPIDTITTSEYGSARTYNGTLKSYHGGVDFRALEPTPIRAANDGVVVLAKERYYAGGTVIIDHGEGIYSCYFHLSQFNVAVGERVERGQDIALSGATGRITGPHLHFGFMVHGIQSDPLDLMTQIETLFAQPSLRMSQNP